ncbi:aminotransferase class I/II-fold pyridoxal phosphate-dependent enzyme [Mesorhizobium abyssinicae]|uniref:aminotransferase class I/II-fold pyridoxal phosphate-dependent enzyme n=1 Tax=Mesorhizobium abyssinicae TaxID=1209958 RepID=UPI002A24E1F2|nr:aminotransferase class I/II-fold pyridoxal phosphate-dependent enzyme [Mesorhizobium abyssinicae]MDX8437692.1 aminotransferase class I/II-fold pyridoxal phosphate-dependent enzyme [Mesorhizobium abyssinicae]
MLARRTSSFGSSGTAAARAAARQAAHSRQEVIDLTAGEIWSELAPTIREGAINAINNGVNRYTDTLGMMELREALARKVSFDTGQTWRADEIAATTGAKQALFNATMVLLNPGDEVIIPCPYWTTFSAQVVIAGGKPVFVDTRSNAYVPRIQDIAAALTEKTRAIVVNTPANPSGAVYDFDTLTAIAHLAINRDLWVIFDECYANFVYGHHAHHPIVSVVPEVRSRTIIVNGFSKSLALTGWRIGYLAAPKEVVDAVRALQSHTTSNPNVIAQHAVLAHLERGDGRHESKLGLQLASSRQIGLGILYSLRRIPAPRAQGGIYFYLDLSKLRPAFKNGPASADDVVTSLLADAGVAAVSGTAFGDPLGLRLSYGIPPEQLQTGLTRLVDLLNSWK